MATFKHGKISSLLSGSTSLNVESVEYDEDTPADDVTHTGAAGFHVGVPGVTKVMVKCAGAYDFDAAYHADPPNITSGQTITAVHAKPDGTVDYSMPMNVTKFSWKGGPKNGAIRFSAELESTGAVTRPS